MQRRYAYPIMGMLLALVSLGIMPTSAVAATIRVTTTADELNTNTKCSLREAVQAANTNKKVGACAAGSSSGTDVISLPSGTYRLTHIGAHENANQTGDLDLLGKTRLVGVGSSTIIDGAAKDRVLDIKKDATITLQSLTVQNGKTDGSNGGAIYNGATLVLDRVTVRGSFAEFGDGGGGIYNAKGRSLTISNSTLRDNYTDVYGGGLANDGTALVKSSTIAYNGSGHGGGGIVSYQGARLTIQDSSVRHNVAEDGSGGGLSNRGTATITNSIFRDNEAWQGETYGGGIDTSPTGLTLTGVTITQNLGGVGGVNGPATAKNTTISGNAKHDYGVAVDCTGPITSRGNVTIGDPEGCTINE